MLVTCPFCRKVFSIQTRITNYQTMECPFCDASFSMNLNAAVTYGESGVWVKSPSVEDIWSNDTIGR